MLWLWLIVFVVLFGFGMYNLGLSDLPDPERDGLFWVIAFGAFGWPLLIAVTIVFGPFYGLYWLGERERKKRKALNAQEYLIEKENNNG